MAFNNPKFRIIEEYVLQRFAAEKFSNTEYVIAIEAGISAVLKERAYKAFSELTAESQMMGLWDIPDSNNSRGYDD